MTNLQAKSVDPHKAINLSSIFLIPCNNRVDSLLC